MSRPPAPGPVPAQASDPVAPARTPAAAPPAPGHGLDGRTWTRYSISIWSDLARTPEERALPHPATFPLALAERLIAVLTRDWDDLVVDPFVGSGTTVLAAARLGRPALGLDVNARYVELARRRLEAALAAGASQSGAARAAGRYRLACDDCRRLERHAAAGSAALCLTSPPYWNVLRRRRTADGLPPRPYSDAPEDLGNVEGYGEYLRRLEEAFAAVHRVLRPGGYLAVVVMDLRQGDRFYPLHADLGGRLQAGGFTWEDLVIWDRRHEYHRLRPLGFPHRFRVNKVHEYVLLLRKPPRGAG